MENSVLDLFSKENQMLKKLGNYYFEIGVFEDKATRKKRKKNKNKQGDFTNAELLRIHEYGSPLLHIPKRPILKITITHRKIQKLIDKIISECEEIIWDGGSENEWVKVLKKGAIRIESFAKQLVMSGDAKLKPNSPKTIAAKGSSLPLIDTGEMIKSIKCVIKKREKK